MMKVHRKESGVVTIEFAVGFFLFMLLFFVWSQIAYMGYVSGLIDYTVAKTARDTRNSVLTRYHDDYQQQFLKFLKKDTGIWGKMVNYDQFTVKSFFYDDVKDLANSCNNSAEQAQQSNCLVSTEAASPVDAPIAVYQVNYHFRPLFGLFSSSNISLKREVFVVQEYERNKFYN